MQDIQPHSNQEYPAVSLTEAQRKLLQKYNVTEEYINLIEKWLNDKSSKRVQDFFLVLADLLLAMETNLSIKRQALAKKLDYQRGILTPDETPPDVIEAENKIKFVWMIATALWRCVDEIMRNPRAYGIEFQPDHVKYVLKTRNFPVLEMFLWARPDFFDVGQANSLLRQIYWLLGGLFGSLLGCIGGFLGGIKAAFELPHVYKLIFPIYALFGLLIGGSSGAVLGAGLGYRTGRLSLALKLAFIAQFINPFHEPKGSKRRQEMDLIIEESLFNTAQQRKLR